MDALAQLIQQAMRRQHMSAEAIAVGTGIRTPRIKAFAEDGAMGPVRPTEEELTALAAMLSMRTADVLVAAYATGPSRVGATS